MKRPILLLLALLGAGACRTASAPVSGSGGWAPLFDGRTLSGWTRANGTAEYRVEDGAIVGRTATGSPNAFLVTNRSYDDFELEFDVRVDPRLNSGVQIRSRPKETTTGTGADERAGRVYGPQVEIASADDDGSLAGFLYGEAAGGWMTPESSRIRHRHFRNGEWNHYRVIARGPRIQTFINGKPVGDLVHEEMYRSHPAGFIGLQVHSIGADEGPYEVRWRNLRIRELPRGG